ncbi:Putative zinc-or iron-chelating domain-containing protein [Dyella sp. OK004]|uniref:YkgJ family cysteine cluster protein n=1 Tax=Dyella sp. OK004 TaxID=1855292 RepID=UPI0008F34A35|nr:Putative zinc-or iron-chelating domain-containing protein [Dyella sp. OK004]
MNTSPDPYAERVDPSVSCDRCEAVCCRLTVVLMPDDNVPDWLIDRHTHGMETLAKGDDGWCVAVDRNTFRCTIYDQRPGICRKFTTGSPGCRYEREQWFDRPAPVGSWRT